jgi:hypothetical protein
MCLTKGNQWHCLLKSHLLLTTRQRFYFYWLRLCYHPLPFNDRSDTTCHFRGLFVRIDLMSLPGSQGSHTWDQYSSFWVLTGHWTSSKM